MITVRRGIGSKSSFDEAIEATINEGGRNVKIDPPSRHNQIGDVVVTEQEAYLDVRQIRTNRDGKFFTHPVREYSLLSSRIRALVRILEVGKYRVRQQDGLLIWSKEE